MPEVTAKHVFEYEGRTYAPGDRLQVADRFVAILVHVGRIEPPEGHAAAGTYRTASISSSPMQKQDTVAEGAAEREKRPRNRPKLAGAARA